MQAEFRKKCIQNVSRTGCPFGNRNSETLGAGDINSPLPRRSNACTPSLTAWARLVPADLGDCARRLRQGSLSLLWADRVSAHLRVFVVLVVQHHHGDQAAAAFLAVNKFRPPLVPLVHTPHETMRPAIAMSYAVLVIQQQRHVYRAFVEGRGNRVPVPPRQIQDFLRLVKGGELSAASDRSPPNGSRLYSLGITTSDQRAKNPSSCSKFIAFPPLQIFEEIAEAVEFGFGKGFRVGCKRFSSACRTSQRTTLTAK
jgi:hypothetical protein